jgi:hypothetical protein
LVQQLVRLDYISRPKTPTQITHDSNGPHAQDSQRHPPICKIINEQLILTWNRKHYAGVNAVKFEDLKGTISTDLPGRFPITSARGQAYVFVMYDYDSNSILVAVPIENRRKESLIQGYRDCLIDLTRAGITITPILHHLDNEISKDMIADEIEERAMDCQIAFFFFKNHFVSVLHGCNPAFPANQWD